MQLDKRNILPVFGESHLFSFLAQNKIFKYRLNSLVLTNTKEQNMTQRYNNFYFYYFFFDDQKGI